MNPLPLIWALLSTSWLTAQVPNPALFNTAADGTTGTVSVGNADPNWEVALGDSLQPTGPFVATTVLGRCETEWYQSGLANVNWVGYDFGNGCRHTSQGCVDLYFRRQWTLPAENDCGQPIEANYCLPVDFYGDNCVYEVLVNGVSNYQYQGPVEPYGFVGFREVTSLTLCAGWQPDANTVVVHLKSCPLSAGLLAEARIRSQAVDRYFLGRDTALCLANELVLRSPFTNTLWFDGSVGAEKKVSQSGTYQATIFDPNGCPITDSIAVQLDYRYYVPNVFSPDGNGENDRFRAYFSESHFLTYQLRVFDRWGNLVFASTDPEAGWDGTANGKNCPPGVYVYVISVSMGDCHKVLEGSVLLMG